MVLRMLLAYVICCFLLLQFGGGAAHCDDQQVCAKGEEDQQTREEMPTPGIVGKIISRVKKSSMAWRSSGLSNPTLVDNLQRNGLFSDERVKKAMLSIDRGDFAPSSPYGDHPVSIGYGATISAPHMHASALELLKDHLKEGDRALDVGSGSGYLTACMAMMVGETGKVVGIEHIKQLVDLSKENVKKNHGDLLTSGRILFVEGDGREGYQAEAPYKAIHVGAAAPIIPPKLVEQLAPGGRMLIPVGRTSQRFVQVDKSADGEVKETDLMGVIYVPLTDRESQLGHS